MYLEVIQVSKVIKTSAMTKRLAPYVRRYNNICLTFSLNISAKISKKY